MDINVKMEDSREKKRFPKQRFFRQHLFTDFELVWGGFGQGLGRVWVGVWRVLGAFWATLDVILRCLSLECGWEGLLEASGLVSGGVWEGFGRGLG